MNQPLFIRPMHPKTEIVPTPDAIKRILEHHWVGQTKIHGHRAQIHVPADPDKKIVVYNRHGQVHKKELPKVLDQEIRQLYTPQKGWNVIDAEWLKPTDQIFVFDILKFNDEVLRNRTYLERFDILPRIYKAEHIITLPLLRTVEKCLDVIDSEDPLVEGLVFKSTTTKGFSDTSIIRARKTSRRT